jgi:hypothetical protein
VYDQASNRLIVFGGDTTSGTENDVWVLENANGLSGTQHWTELLPGGSLPHPRYMMSAVFKPGTNRMTIFGGECYSDSKTRYNDVWVLTDANGIKTITIDIKPGEEPNSINLGSNGNVPVAIFSTADFDATQIDPATVTLSGATVRLKGKGDLYMTSVKYINGDDLLDLLVHVDTTAMQLSEGDIEAVLEGKTNNGLCIRGTDTVRIVP